MNKSLNIVFKNIYLFIELIVISVYLLIIHFSIHILPLNIIFGVICVLFLPGYNLVSIIKPNFNLIKKLGYTTLFSLMIDNFLMIFSYILFYNFWVKSKSTGFFFNPISLITTIQIINIFLIFFILFKKKSLNVIHSYFYDKNARFIEDTNSNQSKLKLKIFKLIKINIKNEFFYLYLLFIISLIFLCILSSNSFANPSDNNFENIQKDYRENFTFFNRVHYAFFIFLFISIVSLTLILFKSKNVLLILISISLFLYSLWIFPYLQIGNFFSHDSYELLKGFNIYQSKGIIASKHNFVIGDINFRYSTSIFTAILLTYATGANINLVLWYIYPLIFFPTPFYFYSVFEKFSTKNNNQNLNLILLTILAICTAQFLKAAHSATTMVLGIYIYFILVDELYEFSLENGINLKIKRVILIISFYLFLCLTHFEEGFYFLVLSFLYNVYYLYFQYKTTDSNYNNAKLKKLKNNQLNLYMFNSSNSKDLKSFSHLKKKELKYNIIINCFLLGSLLIVFYFTQEFFGAIKSYFNSIAGDHYLLRIIFALYRDSRIIKLPFLRGGYKVSALIISMAILGTILFIAIDFILIFNLNWIIYYTRRFFQLGYFELLKIIKKIIRILFIQCFLIFTLFLIIILIDFYYYPFLQERGILLIFELILNYSIIIFNLMLFTKGILYYTTGNHKQNYYLIAIFATSSIMIVTFIAGNIFLTFHLLNARFIPIFIYFNLIIIQNTYFRDLMKKSKVVLFLMTALILFLGAIYSLNKIGWE